jgi:hypothetical protein
MELDACFGSHQVSLPIIQHIRREEVIQGIIKGWIGNTGLSPARSEERLYNATSPLPPIKQLQQHNCLPQDPVVKHADTQKVSF